MIKFSFQGFEDPLSNSSSLPLYDEPVYDVYDDDIIGEVLDFDKPIYDDDDAKMDGQPQPNVQSELFIHNVPNKTTITLTIIDKKITCKDLFNGLERESLIFSSRWLKETHLVLDAFTIIIIPSAYATLEILKIGMQIDTGWTYLDLFSQPNPPPYGVQSDIFL
ncbi:hypothetical protein MA16_Dca027826 [Dendrobium catenatum]|uniref:Uncharacterized protein n=1 Tax=Dendrobium catenatum TaxID=906689 RepID=A0A2I0VA04_9ASPA|nr:hypothetical protein MA16_Dca027826 [Dendrobium catenatum]